MTVDAAGAERIRVLDAVTGAERAAVAIAAPGGAGIDPGAPAPLAKRSRAHDILAMSLPPGFLDELRSRVSLAQVVGRRVTWDARKSNPGKARLLGALPVPPGEVRVVPRR